MQILFCIVIVIPEGISGKHSLKVSSISDNEIMSKLVQIEAVQIVPSSCCFTIPELVLSAQFDPETNIFQLIPTNKVTDQFITGPFSIRKNHEITGPHLVRSSMFHFSICSSFSIHSRPYLYCHMLECSLHRNWVEEYRPLVNWARLTGCRWSTYRVQVIY